MPLTISEAKQLVSWLNESSMDDHGAQGSATNLARIFPAFAWGTRQSQPVFHGPKITVSRHAHTDRYHQQKVVAGRLGGLKRAEIYRARRRKER